MKKDTFMVDQKIYEDYPYYPFTTKKARDRYDLWNKISLIIITIMVVMQLAGLILVGIYMEFFV